MKYFTLILFSLLTIQDLVFINAMNEQEIPVNESVPTPLQKKRAHQELSSDEENDEEDNDQEASSKKIALEQCVICLDDMSNDDAKNPTHQLACNHIFHRVCIDEWRKNSFSCPCCRTIAPEDQHNADLMGTQGQWREAYNGIASRNQARFAIFSQTEFMCGLLRDDVRTKALELLSQLNRRISNSAWYEIASLAGDYRPDTDYPSFLSFSQFYHDAEARQQVVAEKAREIVEQYLAAKQEQTEQRLAAEEDRLSRNYETALKQHKAIPPKKSRCIIS